MPLDWKKDNFDRHTVTYDKQSKCGKLREKMKWVNPQILLYLLGRKKATYPKEKLCQITTIKFKRITQTHEGKNQYKNELELARDSPNTARKDSENIELVGE